MPDKTTILLVEDEAIIRMNEARILKEQGYDVIDAATGEKALDTVRSGHRIDLILMDINLGKGMDGTQAAQEILKEHDIPIIFLSVHTEGDIVEKTKGITSYGYVVKDSGAAVLITSVKMALSLYETRRELQKHEEMLTEELSKRKNAEEAFRLSEGGFRTLYENMRDAYVSVDMDGRILRYNSEYKDIIGYSDDEIAGLTYMDLTPEKWHGFEAAIIRGQVLVKGYSSVYEKEYRRKDGTIVPVELRATLIRDENGKPTGMWGIVRDITERKEAEKALIESEKRYRTAVEGSNDGVALVNKGEILYVNRKFVEIFGYEKPEDLVGQSAFSIVHSDDIDVVKDYNRRRELGEAVATQYEFKGIRRDGETVFIEMSLSRILYQGEMTTFSFLRDITRRRKAEEGWKLNETRLESLLKISQHRGRSTEELLDFALEQAIALTRSKIGYIYFYDEQTREFNLNTWSRDVMNECRVRHPKTVYNLEKTGIWGEAVRQRKAIILNDYKAPNPFKKGYPEGHADLARFLTIPVVIQNSLVAVVGVANKDIDYDDSDVRQLTLLMDSAWQFTEGKKAEEAIRRSEEKYRNIFDNALEGIFQMTAGGSFIGVNPAFARMYGFDSPEELMRIMHDARQLFSNPEDRRSYAKILREKGMVEKYEVPMFKKDGTVICISISAHIVEDAAGIPLYYEGTVEDVTTRKTAETSLLNALAELESKNHELAETHAAFKESQKKIFQQEKMASIGQLAAGVAHEINNPTGFIISNLNSQQKYMNKIREFITIQSEAVEGLLSAEMDGRESILKHTGDERRKLKIDYLLEDSKNLIGESLDGAERIKRIVQDLKSFSRADDTGYTVTDINRTLESTLNIVWNELKYKARVKKEYGEVPLIRCNPGQLSQVFMNILVNASHAIPESGEITIKTWHEDPNVYVAISDTGTGIPEDQLGRIFEPFFTTKEIGKGTGLGLSISYDIMQKHNGEIGVTSKVGEGTTFTLTIPKEAQNNG